MGIENPVHLIFIGIVALLVLGPKRLPELARALGHGIREFRQAVNSGGEELHAPLADPAVSQTPIAQPVLEPPSHTPLAQAHEHTVESTAEEEPDPASAPVDPAEPIRSGNAPDSGPL
jgi:sec-independent protein translocase protein TatA